MEMYMPYTGYFLHTFVVICMADFSQGHDHTSGARIEMVHKHDFRRNLAQGKLPPMTKLDVIRRALHSDTFRQRVISERVRKKRSGNRGRQAQEYSATNVPVEMPMFSGSDYGEGNYFVTVKIGTPPRKYLLTADTGSDLNWVNCKQEMDKHRSFRIEQSSSFSILPCSSKLCAKLTDLFSRPDCPSPTSPCIYDYKYFLGSTTGVFAHDMITLGLKDGNEIKINDTIIGCSDFSSNESSPVGEADGLLALGYHNYSFALSIANKFGGKFSYCLVDHMSPHNESSYLIFGPHESEASIQKIEKMQETKLLLGLISPYYVVNIQGISIGDKILAIPDIVWNGSDNGGVIIDSGSTITFLTQPAYEPVMEALTASLSNVKRVNVNDSGLEFCFSSKGFTESMVPRLAFHFVDGAKFQPPVKNYVVDTDDNIKCLGFRNKDFPGQCVIGNIMQQHHIWEFDLQNEKLRFSYSNCA